MKIDLEQLKKSENETMPWEREYSDEQRTEMKVRKEAGELLPGHKKKVNVYGRRDITDKDLQLLAFIATFKFTTAKQAAVLLKVQPKTAERRLRGLEEKPLRLVSRIEIPGTGILWVVTEKAINMLDVGGLISTDDVTVLRPERFNNIASVAHTLAVNQVAAHLLAGRKMIKGLGAVTLSELVPEITIEREWAAIKTTVPTHMKLGTGLAGERLKGSVLRDLKEGSIEWDEVINQNPALWTLTHSKTSPTTHVEMKIPDLVINLEEGRENRHAHSIAIEVELNDKSYDRYLKIMRTYEADRFVYGRVVWVIQANRQGLMRKIARACKEVGIGPDRVSFVQLLDGEGKPFTDPAWKL